MNRANRYGVRSLEKEFPTEEICLSFLFDAQHGRQCSCGGTYKLRTGRKQFQCSKCRFAVSPTAGSIFHKSDTPLTLWFKAILIFSSAKSGISAKELERQLEVTYKTAWRMLMLIRKALSQGDDKLRGIVEMDTAYFGGVYKAGKNNERLWNSLARKTIVMGAVERGGQFRAKVVPNAGGKQHTDFLQENVEKDSFLMSDASRSLMSAGRLYDHYTVDHSKREYVRGPVHVNNVETFWSHVKRSVKGTHKAISKKYSQEYLNGFVFHYNNRHSDRERFGLLLGRLLQSAR
jgi:transposase